MAKRKKYCNWTIPQMVEALSKKEEYTAREVEELGLFSKTSLNSANRAGLLRGKYYKDAVRFSSTDLIEYISYYIRRHEGQVKATLKKEQNVRRRMECLDSIQGIKIKPKHVEKDIEIKPKQEKFEQTNFVSQNKLIGEHNGREVRVVDAASTIKLSKYECLVKMPTELLKFMSNYMNMSKMIAENL